MVLGQAYRHRFRRVSGISRDISPVCAEQSGASVKMMADPNTGGLRLCESEATWAPISAEPRPREKLTEMNSPIGRSRSALALAAMAPDPAAACHPGVTRAAGARRLAPRRFGVRARSVWLAVGVTALAALTVVWLLAGAAHRPAGRTVAAHGFASVPLAARGPISAALGSDELGYRVVGLQARNPAQHLGVNFSRAGATVASGATHFRLSLAGFGYASALRDVGSASPRASGSRVDYARGGLREWYANGPLGLEQGFDVAARPSTGSGPLTLSLALSGNVRARLDGTSAVLLQGPGAALRYGGLSVSDARGHKLHSWLEVRDGHVLIKVADRGAAYPLRVDPFVQQAKLTSSDGEADDFFGYAAVAVSGNTVVVGAGYHNGNRGAVYVFEKPASGWADATQTAELTASDGVPGDYLGYAAVGISGDTVVAGSGYHGGTGAAYVFVKPASGWVNATQTAELTASDGAASDYFAYGATAISGDTIVVGAGYHKVGANADQGVVYVFVKPASGWANATQNAELTASDGASGDYLGYWGIGISGDTVVAGSGYHGGTGAAYVFVMPSSGWANATQTAELTPSDGVAGDYFAYLADAVSGNTIVIGAGYHKVGANHAQGAAYVFVKPPSGWANATQTAELTASDGAPEDYFGYAAVAVSGDTVVVGSGYHKVGTNANQGAAYVFVKPSSGWANATQTSELVSSDGEAGDYFGYYAVAIENGTVVVGAGYHKVGAHFDQGEVYVSVAPPPSISISAPANGAVFTQGQAVTAAYACSAAAITSCAGTTAVGAPIDTSTLGSHSFTVNSEDSDGVTASQTVTYSVVAPAPLMLPLPLSIGAFGQTASVWREGNGLAQLSAKGKKPPLGTTFSFTLNEPGAVTLTFSHRVGGRKAHGKCVAPSAKNKRKPGCKRTITAGTLKFSGHAGVNKVRFFGPLSHSKKLKPGRYTLQISAKSATGSHATSKPLSFTIVK